MTGHFDLLLFPSDQNLSTFPDLVLHVLYRGLGIEITQIIPDLLIHTIKNSNHREHMW